MTLRSSFHRRCNCATLALGGFTHQPIRRQRCSLFDTIAWAFLANFSPSSPQRCSSRRLAFGFQSPSRRRILAQPVVSTRLCYCWTCRDRRCLTRTPYLTITFGFQTPREAGPGRTPCPYRERNGRPSIHSGHSNSDLSVRRSLSFHIHGTRAGMPTARGTVHTYVPPMV